MSVRVIHGETRELNGRFLPGVHSWRQPRPHWEKSWLQRHYVELEKSASEIASIAGCHPNNILHWLDKHGIERRSTAEARSVKKWAATGEANGMHGRVGELNPRYVDGSAPERQRLYSRGEGRDFLRAVYARDGFKCRRCGAPKNGPRSLHAHHLKPWAGNPALRFDMANAVTLCRCCHQWVHSLANVDREYLA